MAKIEISKDGPFIVKQLNKLTSSQGEFEVKEQIALCRCGASKNKPYCDGSHISAKFSGEKQRDEEYETLEFKGEKLTVVDNIGICCHAGECVKGAPKAFFTFDGSKRISKPDEDAKENIIQTIRKCPSGSLAYKLNGKLYDEYFSQEEIFISKNGPLHIRGGIQLDDPATKELVSKEHYTLCRCGASKNKPFCDGTHKKINFTD